MSVETFTPVGKLPRPQSIGLLGKQSQHFGQSHKRPRHYSILSELDPACVQRIHQGRLCSALPSPNRKRSSGTNAGQDGKYRGVVSRSANSTRLFPTACFENNVIASASQPLSKERSGYWSSSWFRPHMTFSLLLEATYPLMNVALPHECYPPEFYLPLLMSVTTDGCHPPPPHRYCPIWMSPPPRMLKTVKKLGFVCKHPVSILMTMTVPESPGDLCFHKNCPISLAVTVNTCCTKP